MEIHIRPATFHDAPAIRTLLDKLGYKTTISNVISQLDRDFDQQQHQAFVATLDKEVAGFISLHYLPLLGFEANLAIISYLAADQEYQDKPGQIEAQLEQYAAAQAQQHKCHSIQVHVLDWRSQDHQFYKQQGYREYPKYFSKQLSAPEGA